MTLIEKPEKFNVTIDNLKNSNDPKIVALLGIIEWYDEELHKYNRDRDWVYEEFEEYLRRAVDDKVFNMNDWDLLIDVIKKDFPK